MNGKIYPYPKIFAVGSNHIPGLFLGQVEITEKIDGSMFAFGADSDGNVVMRSKGKELFFDAPEKMFKKGIDYVASIADKLRELGRIHTSITYYGEFLGSPGHNVLKYGRVPINHIMIFGVMLNDSWVHDYDVIRVCAEDVGLEAVPLLHSGPVLSSEELNAFFERDSVLGVEKLEGVVVKNFLQKIIIGNQVLPSFGKFVRAEFKERHAKDWGPKFSEADKFGTWIESFRSEARWHKAVQHLRDNGQLENEPKDIGVLLREVERDLLEEEAANIKEELFKLFKEQVVRKAKAGFPDWYKAQLAKLAFPVEIA